MDSQNKILKAGPGYICIYSSSVREINLSEETMIINKINSGRKLYKKIKKVENKKKIEKRSENWGMLVDYSEKYWIFIQRDAYDNETGFVKILSKKRTKKVGFHIDAETPDDWKYYARRGKTDEF